MTTIRGECNSGTISNGNIIFSSKNEYYNGNSINGTRNGKGTHIVNNTISVGEQKNGMKNGYSCVSGVFTKDDRYCGNWVNDIIDGKGAYYYQNGDIYNGYWKNGQRNGDGNLTFKKYENLRTFDGNWRNDSMHGFGKYHIEGNDYYVRMENNDVVGNVVIRLKNGDNFEGDINLGNSDGYEISCNGKLTHPNGDYYIGKWAKSKLEGHATIYKDGIPEVYRFINGEVQVSFFREIYNWLCGIKPPTLNDTEIHIGLQLLGSMVWSRHKHPK